MSQKWFNGLNLQQNQLENAVIQNLASDPSSGKAGQIYYNTTDNGYRYYNGTAWVNISADAIKSIVAGNGLTSTGTDTVTISLGTPSTVNQTSTNSTTTTSHTHKLEFAAVSSPAASGNEISFIDTVSQGVNGGISATKKTVRSASTTQTGVVQLATQNEVNTGTDTTKVITPATLGKGKASGVASLDSNSKIITSQLPDYLLGQVMYGGNASTVATTTTISPSDSLKTKKNITATSISIVDSATSTTANTYGWQNMEGVYFICQASGTFAGVSFETGDWIISTGAKWEKIDNTDAVKSVNGQIGDVNLTRVNEAGTADKLKTARTIALKGDATGSTTFDGSANKDINVTLANTGVAAGTYNNVTVDAKGRVTAASSKNYSTKVVQTITGDGSKTSFDVAHTLGADVSVQVYLKNQTVGADTVDELVMVDTYTLNNKVKLLFATAPTTTQTFKVVIIG